MTTISLKRTETIESTRSTWTISEFFGFRIPLERLIQLTDRHRSLRRAEILSAEGYWKKTNGVVHRFLLLELRRQNQSEIWLRLDRDRNHNVGLLKLALASGETLANDLVRDALRVLRGRPYRRVLFRLNSRQVKVI